MNRLSSCRTKHDKEMGCSIALINKVFMYRTVSLLVLNDSSDNKNIMYFRWKIYLFKKIYNYDIFVYYTNNYNVPIKRIESIIVKDKRSR